MSSRGGKITGFFAQALKMLEQIFFKAYFWLGQWVLYFAIFISALLVLEVLSFAEPQFFYLTNTLGMIASLSSVIFSAVQILIGLIPLIWGDAGMIQRGWSLLIMAGWSFVGHWIAMMIDIIFQPLFTILNILNITAKWILVDGTTQTLEGGRVIPAICTPYISEDKVYYFPEYNVGDIKVLSGVIDTFKTVLGTGIPVCVRYFLGQNAEDTLALAGFSRCGQLALNDIPGLKQSYDGLIALETTPLFPADLLMTIFKAIEDFLRFFFPEISGTDLVRHFVFLDRLEFNSNNTLAPNQGSDPFKGQFRSKIEDVFGCQYVI